MYKKSSKTIRLVVGIISIVISCVVLFQSCAAGIVNAVESNSDSGGTAGAFVSIIMLTAGIISIAARKTKGGTITSLIFYAVGAIIAMTNSKVYTDLLIWGIVEIIFALLLVISLRMKESNISD